ncbi:adhesion protein [Aerococcus urinaehominis]|uniref:Adhesion protein n=1 Tax=Aerococcus urinaehominis TaxID=128944 RepID=A0A0X8FM49_9LACT|nr:zinc ABC transporter substrate-binding protein [Aerococcus urinaehominis]AMB99857.1 adhesion protein [Aerococcus urinaehominis]SDM53862.1 zinc transport system substrate-binding protein [Aerococcus urinaehominis]
MKKITKILLALASLALVLAGCGSKGGDQKAEGQGMQIVTSFYPVYQITKAVAGDLNTVQMIQSSQGIHDFEPSASDMAAIEDSDVFVYHSRTLEGWAKNIGQDGKPTTIEASEGVELKKVAGLEDMQVSQGMDEKSLYDPHSWLDPVLAGQEALYIADRLSEIDPDNKETYQANAQAFKDRADKLVADYQDKFASLDNKTFVTQHTAFAYLADRFGLKQLGIAGVESNTEPTAQQLTEIQDFVKANNVKTIFVEPNTSQKIAQVVAEATGAKIETLDPLEADPKTDDSFLDLMEKNLETLYQALKNN